MKEVHTTAIHMVLLQIIKSPCLFNLVPFSYIVFIWRKSWTNRPNWSMCSHTALFFTCDISTFIDPLAVKICGFIFPLFPVLFLAHFLQVHWRPKAKNHPGHSKHEIHFNSTVKNLLDHKSLLEYHRSKDDAAQCFFHVNSNANKPFQVLCGYYYTSITSTLQQYWRDSCVHAFSGEHEQIFFEGPLAWQQLNSQCLHCDLQPERWVLPGVCE